MKATTGVHLGKAFGATSWVVILLAVVAFGAFVVLRVPSNAPLSDDVAAAANPQLLPSAVSSPPAGAKRTEEEIGAIALAALQRMSDRASDLAPDIATIAPRVVKAVFTSRGEAAKIEPGIGAPDPGTPEAARRVWVVRAEGRFVGDRVPPGADPVIGRTGYLVIDDATGEIIGMGMP